jgi:hypothetical protein
MFNKGDIFEFNNEGRQRIKIVNVDHNDVIYYVHLWIPKRERKGYTSTTTNFKELLSRNIMKRVTELPEDLFNV